MSETTWRGKLGKMSDEDREAFLAEGRVMRIAFLKEDGTPSITVCWHDWYDGYFWLVPRQRAKWAERLASDGRLSFVIDDAKTMQKVIGDGIAELVEEPNVGGAWVLVATRMSVRYLGPDGPTYLTSTLNQPRWLFRFRPTNVKTWQGVGWARRYWVEDTGGPSYDEAHSTAQTGMRLTERVRTVGSGSGSVTAGDLQLECIATPGHAYGHLSFLLDNGGAVCSRAT